MYLSGKDYYENLVKLYGEKVAKKRAEMYLGFQCFHDEEEYRFCSELRQELNNRRFGKRN